MLPSFKYHPDPISTGAIEPSSETCKCCAQSRGFIYVGPVYAVEEYERSICPWCIADGSAHVKFDAIFTDDAGVGGGGTWCDVPQSVIDEVANRTPGFNGWQQEQWWTHCHDAGQFLGRAGKKELQTVWLEAVAEIRDSTGLDGAGWQQFLDVLDKDGSPTAYVFRCVHCGAMGGYQDCD
jgi:uncharacterized protein